MKKNFKENGEMHGRPFHQQARCAPWMISNEDLARIRQCFPAVGGG
jgi:hypothetical protein